MEGICLFEHYTVYHFHVLTPPAREVGILFKKDKHTTANSNGDTYLVV